VNSFPLVGQILDCTGAFQASIEIHHQDMFAIDLIVQDIFNGVSSGIIQAAGAGSNNNQIGFFSQDVS